MNEFSPRCYFSFGEDAVGWGVVRAQPGKFARLGHVWTTLCRDTNTPALNLNAFVSYTMTRLL